MIPHITTNNVKYAVKKAGGATRVASALGVSGTTVHNWVRKRKITNIDKAKMLAKMSGFKVEDLRPC